MVKKIYRFYKQRLVEISGRSRSLYSKKIAKKNSYDIGRLLNGDYAAIDDFVDFLWNARRTTYQVIDKSAEERIARNLGVLPKIGAQFIDKRPMKAEQVKTESARRERIKRDESKKAILSQVNDLKTLKRELEELSRETGRYELFVGYPFVEGSIGREMVIRAPLLLFPVVIHVINETTVELELKQNEQIQLNKVFALAYAKHYRLNTEDMNMEFPNLSKLKNIDEVVKYLRGFGFKMQHPTRKGMFDFEKAKEPYLGDPIEVKHYAVLGRFPLANAIYSDYNLLEKKKPTQAIRELLQSRNSKRIKNPNTNLYVVNSLDFAQEDAIGKLNQHGNMVIYGPPGTGKSQTIVNIITDALCKNKRVLVVSQKKAALDVVFNRLGTLSEKAMYIIDPEKNKNDFYLRTKGAHQSILGHTDTNTTKLNKQYHGINNALQHEMDILQTISDTMFKPTPFGPTLQEMYARSYIFGKDSSERKVYSAMLKNANIMRLDFQTLDNTIRIIKEKRKGEIYFKRLSMLRENPMIDHIKTDLDMHTINTARSFISKFVSKRIIPFNISKYPNARQCLAFYLENGLSDRKSLSPIIRQIAKIEDKRVAEVAANFDRALVGVKSYVDEFALLETVLDKRGFAMTIENILNGNTLFLKMLYDALGDYVHVRDINLNMNEMGDIELLVLNFAYELADNLTDFREVIDKLVAARIYHELVSAEERCKLQLSKIIEFDSIKDRIVSLKDEQHDIVRQICAGTLKKQYCDLYNSDPENKNFLYQISKQQGLWPIRQLMEIYSELMLTLFPCWLLSPEGVSTVMPLKQNLFDLILFDEASQIFIESTLPTIYRGRYIAVAGDNKQLRPTALFMRRYMGNDTDDLDLSTKAALEVESLLDLATSRYNSINLNYHYRSKHEEFINFSNHAFYDCKLQIAPNTTKNRSASAKPPIERIMVNGLWNDRKNRAEGTAVVTLLKKIFRTRREGESIGIVTFNAEQEAYIEDLIDKECIKDENFRKAIIREQNRRENGEDISMFVKNIENVQGDERDIIIFSIGYAKNEYGKIISHFGTLNQEGGENRLNVAITRAKKKVYVVTSIEPEQLHVEDTKNMGPKIFKKYLQYVRAVSSGNRREASGILETLSRGTGLPMPAVSATRASIADEIKRELEALGYTVEQNLGNSTYKLSLAIYDKESDKYLVGIECDDAAYRSSSSILERDVFRSKFLESRGWKIIRVWSRDWWMSPTKVMNTIVKAAHKSLRPHQFA